MKKIIKAIKNFFHHIWHFIDRIIIMPITKLVYKITNSTSNPEVSKKIEKWLSSNNALLYISLFIAIALFVGVDQKILLYSENSAEVLKDQAVKVIYNEEAYVVEGLPTSVDITLIGSSSDLYFATQSPQEEVVIDLSNLKPGTHKVNITYNKILPSIEYEINPSSVTVNIYDKVSETKTLALDLLNEDALDETLIVKSTSIKTDQVTIKGALKDIDRVAIVKALVDLNQLVTQETGETTLTNVPLRAYDTAGNVVDVEIVPEKIDVTLDIESPSKTVSIILSPTGDPSFGYAINTIEANASSVTLYGSEETLDSINYVTVNVDISGLKDNKEYKLELPTIVGIRSMSIKNITVNVTMDKSADKTLTDVAIEYRNLGAGLAVQALSVEDTKVDVTLKGVASVLEGIETSDVAAYLDLDGLGVGEHEVEVNVQGSDNRVQYVSKTKKVQIKIIAS